MSSFFKLGELATLCLYSTPIEVLVVLTRPGNKLSKMAGNSASYIMYSRYNELPSVTIN